MTDLVVWHGAGAEEPDAVGAGSGAVPEDVVVAVAVRLEHRRDVVAVDRQRDVGVAPLLLNSQRASGELPGAYQRMSSMALPSKSPTSGVKVPLTVLGMSEVVTAVAARGDLDDAVGRRGPGRYKKTSVPALPVKSPSKGSPPRKSPPPK